MNPHVVVISTGGTITMRYDPVKKGDVPAVSGAELVAAIPALKDIGAVDVVEFSNIPSFHMTPEIMWELAREVEKIRNRDEVSGIVITHGTDTLEESAYFLDLYLSPGKPVCLTGAMRTSAHPSPDGPYNILCAARAAASPTLAGHGVLVVMNGEIHAARHVSKTHTSSVGAFASPLWGPIGHVEEHIILTGPPLPQDPLMRPEKIAGCVPIIKIYSGMDNALLDALADMQPDGIVLEGYGRGNFPATILEPLQKILSKGIPVVAASRVPFGRTLGVYATEGGGAHLQSLGVILSGALSSQKARIRLLFALGHTQNAPSLARYFQ